ncbi:MAG: radical SAM protein [Hyphomicrobiales bacterium]|nr:MAG: radical SAM protein [Hyphomicrobiales bacterium]
MPLVYDMPLYRPPSEGRNLIIQATLGCSFNRCTFCSMYKSKTYQARPLGKVKAEIDRAAARFPGAGRVFLADGDALALPGEHLEALLIHLAARLPGLTRVSCYATPQNLLGKSPDELAHLRELGLKLVYLGIESGDNAILKRIVKGASRKTLAGAIRRAGEAGLKVSATVILGLGGRGDWQAHIDGTAELINTAPPTYLSTLQLMLEEGASRDFMAGQPDNFAFQDDAGILAEQARLIDRLDPPRPVIFRSNHASNCLALAGNLPRDRERLLGEINAVRSGAARLRPDFLRGL